MRFAYVFTIIGIIFISGCVDSEQFNVQKDNAMGVVDIFYTKYNSGDYQAISQLFDSRALPNETSKQQLISLLADSKEILGNEENYNLIGWKVTKYNQLVGTIGSGDFILLQYLVRYTNYSSIDTFEIFNPEGTNEYKILTYSLNSPEAPS